MTDQQHVRGGVGRSPVLWGLAAAVSAFAAAALGLTGTGAQLTAWQFVWMAIASLVPGVVAGAKIRMMERNAEASRTTLEDLRAEVVDLAARLRQREEDDEVERGTTAVTLGQLGATLARIVTGGVLGRRQETQEAAGHFAQVVVEALHEVLGGDTGRARGPLRVLFLQHLGGRDRSLADPLPKPGGAPVVFTAKWAIGYRTPLTWELREDADDAETARRIMARRPPWDDGSLLIDDIGKVEYARGYQVLRPPDEGVASYCRVAVIDEQRHHGLLCIDAWQPGALTVGDEVVAQSFAVLLAAGLSVAAAFAGDVIHLPGESDRTGRDARGSGA